MTATVLIVDDSTFIVEGLTAILRKSYRPIPTFGGEECLAVLKKERPDVIVLDIMMEPMDGWETLARIKDNPVTRHIPVLMFSAKKVSPEEAEAHRIRIDDFLTKPVNPRELIAAIEKILERDRQNRAIIHHWGKAGVPREKIDEYLTCSANIEVDSSLLAALQKQLTHPTTTPVRRDDLTAMITMLGERIRAGRAQLEEFIRTSGLTIPSPSDLPETEAGGGNGSMVPAGVPAEPAPVPEPVPAGTETPAPAEPADTAPEPSSPAEEPAVTLPVDTPPSIPVPELWAARAAPEAAPGAGPSRGEEPPAVEPPVPSRESGTGSPAAIPSRVPAEEPLIRAQEPVAPAREDTGSIEWIPIPSHATPVKEGRLPAAADWTPVTEGTAPAAPGSGTAAHVPLPLAARGTYEGSRSGKEEEEPDEPGTGGFFSRILAMIAGIFGKKK